MWKRDQRSLDALRLQKSSQVRQRSAPETQPMTLCGRNGRALFHGSPSGSSRRPRVGRKADRAMAVPKLPLEVGSLAAQGGTTAQRLHCLAAQSDFGMPPQEGRDRFVLPEVRLEKVGHGTPVKASEPVQLQRRHAPPARFHLGDRGTRNVQALRDFRLRQLPRLPRLLKPTAQLGCRDGQSISLTVGGKMAVALPSGLEGGENTHFKSRTDVMCVEIRRQRGFASGPRPGAQLAGRRRVAHNALGVASRCLRSDERARAVTQPSPIELDSARGS